LQTQVVVRANKKAVLVEPFEIDQESLAGYSPSYIFTLGVEWELFRQKLYQGTPFTMLCLPENRTRFVRMAERHERYVEDRQNGAIGWTEIWVGDFIV
jgi:hypothetical protein